MLIYPKLNMFATIKANLIFFTLGPQIKNLYF